MRHLAAVGAGTGQIAAPAVRERSIASLNPTDWLFGSSSGSYLGIKLPEREVNLALAASAEVKLRATITLLSFVYFHGVDSCFVRQSVSQSGRPAVYSRQVNNL